MSNLLDLPAELFQMVIHELVIASKDPSYPWRPSPHPGIGQLWKLRGVCRSFAAEIEREVFSQQPREFYSHRNIQRLIKTHFSRFVSQVSRKPGSVNEKMFTRLQRMVQYIVEQVEYEDKEQRNEVIDKTYSGLIQMRDLTSLNTILRYLETQSPSIQISLTSTYGMFSLSRCTKITLWKKYLPAAQLLLDYYEKNLPYPSNKIYSGWVGEASANCSLDQLEALKAVLRFNTGSKNMIGPDTLGAVYAKGNSTAIEEVLQHVEDINKGTNLTAPMFIAVRSGRPIAIRACLQAGANVNLSMRPDMRATGRTHITPLETAVHRYDVSIARTLIESGATIPHISKWPTHERTYRLLHEAASKLTDVVLPGLEHFKRCNKNDLKTFKY
ncbi:unnamed protein product [Alternaria alternata]